MGEGKLWGLGSVQWLVGVQTAGRPKLRVRAATTKAIAVMGARAVDMVAVAVAMTIVAVEGVASSRKLLTTATKFASLS